MGNIATDMENLQTDRLWTRYTIKHVTYWASVKLKESCFKKCQNDVQKYIEIYNCLVPFNLLFTL